MRESKITVFVIIAVFILLVGYLFVYQVRVTEVGSVEPDVKVDVKSVLSGKVVELLVREGDRVRRGCCSGRWPRPSAASAPSWPWTRPGMKTAPGAWWSARDGSG